jgi:hypothetical protein
MRGPAKAAPAGATDPCEAEAPVAPAAGVEIRRSKNVERHRETIRACSMRVARTGLAPGRRLS